MNKREVMFCQIHGETEFAERKDGNRTKWKCLKCEAEAVQRRRDKVKLMSIAYKGGKCQCCGYNKYVGALEFHHINSEEKDFGISAKGYTRSWKRVKEELDKCILVCANCHREIHGNIIPCPTLIYPRPEGVVSDADMDRVFLSYSFEEILNMIQK